MKGQVCLEELLSLGIYLLLLSMLIAGVFTMKGAGEQWSREITLRAEAATLAQAHDAFFNSNLYDENWGAGGKGYIEMGEEGETAVPVLEGKVEVAKGEPV